MANHTPYPLDDGLGFFIQSEEIANAGALLPEHSHEGAVLVFLGLVRDFNKVKDGVESIEYSAYQDMAEEVGIAILKEAREQFEISRVLCVHRIGRLRLQEIAIHLEIRSSHRLASLKACEYIMDRIKQDVPIWKKEFYSSHDRGKSKGEGTHEYSEGEWTH